MTDRRRLILRGQWSPAEGVARVVGQVGAAASAGVDLVIVREPDLPAADLAALVRRAIAAAGGKARVLVNDRLDVALACGADGVHLRERSFDVAAVRQIAPRPFLVGRSVHDPSAAAAAGDADYLIAGTVFATPSKPSGTRLLGVEGLRGVVDAARVPVLGIGGIDTPDAVRAVRATGAAGVAVVGALQPVLGAGDEVTSVQNCVRRLRSGFDLS